MHQSSQCHIRFERLGRYELLDELGHDSEGTLYKARDPLLGRLVVIKTVQRDAAEGSGIADYERKVRLAGGLAHPNIASIYDAATNREVAYAVTELVDGETLRDMLDRGVDLAPVLIERIAAQVADGLDFMHRHGIVHGAVDPCNVVVLDIGFVKLSYLGNALFPMGSSMTGHRDSATSRYASPEHIRAAPVDARSDVFSLGVVLYEMLTGAAPFSGSTGQELADAIVNEHPLPPSSLNRDIPSGFDYIVARALAKEPEHRYQTARDMAAHLRRWALEERTFFSPPHAAAAAAQASLPQPADIALSAGTVRTRRQWLRYGIPGALLTMSAAWTMWPRSTPEPSSARATSAIPDVPAAAGAELVHVRDEAPPAIAPPDAAPVDAAPDVEPAGARMEKRPVARLKLAVSPWGEIYVDGHRRGVSPPLTHIDLAPGKHRIEIRNTTFPSRRESIDAKANTNLRIKHKFK
ncbi:MAG TPA: serine/threonine-protein kinase [Casimicrobiaceae bacterium]